jgi:hypothetical protein
VKEVQTISQIQHAWTQQHEKQSAWFWP